MGSPSLSHSGDRMKRMSRQHVPQTSWWRASGIRQAKQTGGTTISASERATYRHAEAISPRGRSRQPPGALHDRTPALQTGMLIHARSDHEIQMTNIRR
jgi:hypothetical protein